MPVREPGRAGLPRDGGRVRRRRQRDRAGAAAGRRGWPARLGAVTGLAALAAALAVPLAGPAAGRRAATGRATPAGWWCGVVAGAALLGVVVAGARVGGAGRARGRVVAAGARAGRPPAAAPRRRGDRRRGCWRPASCSPPSWPPASRRGRALDRGRRGVAAPAAGRRGRSAWAATSRRRSALAPHVPAPATCGSSPPRGRSPTAPGTAWPTPFGRCRATRSAPARRPAGWSRASWPRPAPPPGWSPALPVLALLMGSGPGGDPVGFLLGTPAGPGLPRRRAGVRARRAVVDRGDRRRRGRRRVTRRCVVGLLTALAVLLAAPARPRLAGPSAARPRRPPDRRLAAPVARWRWAVLAGARRLRSSSAAPAGGSWRAVAAVGDLVARSGAPSRAAVAGAARGGPPRPARTWCSCSAPRCAAGVAARPTASGSSAPRCPGPPRPGWPPSPTRLALGVDPAQVWADARRRRRARAARAARWPAPTRPAPRWSPPSSAWPTSSRAPARAEVEERARAVGVKAARAARALPAARRSCCSGSCRWWPASCRRCPCERPERTTNRPPAARRRRAPQASRPGPAALRDLGESSASAGRIGRPARTEDPR